VAVVGEAALERDAADWKRAGEQSRRVFDLEPAHVVAEGAAVALAKSLDEIDGMDSSQCGQLPDRRRREVSFTQQVHDGSKPPVDYTRMRPPDRGLRLGEQLEQRLFHVRARAIAGELLATKPNDDSRHPGSPQQHRFRYGAKLGLGAAPGFVEWLGVKRMEAGGRHDVLVLEAGRLEHCRERDAFDAAAAEALDVPAAEDHR
jgi:hypothetical protein